MTSLKPFNRRVGSLFAVAALLFATITPGLVPAFASAAQLTERTVTLSSSSKQATGVTYSAVFTSVGAAKAVVFDFCSDSPLINGDCTAPTGFTVASAADSGGFTRTTGGANDANTAIYTGTIGAASVITVPITSVTNPDAAGPLYVRIVTYDGADTAAAETAAKAYTSTSIGSGNVDQGSAAVSITDTVGVSGAVRETMTFCVSGSAITAENCGSVTAPTLKLGEGTGNNMALTPSAVSQGSIYSQISTNAASGAVVNLKSMAVSCGGLVRAGAPTSCDITPALATDISAGQAKFGAKVAATTDPGTGSNSNGTFRAAGDTPYYSDTVFKLNYVSGNATGITSPYGDPFLDTNNAPISNKNVQITFGASVANNTPAGLYSTDLSLIATGKF